MADDLSVCIITYNDAPWVTGCLSRAERLSRDIIVADIGSTDGTVGMARQCGAQVLEAKWNNNFSAVRNLCMDEAKSRWVLFLQANEIIECNSLGDLLKNPNAEAYMMTVDYHSQRFCIASPVQGLRLVRRHKENRFQYRSFEMIPDEILTGVADARIVIRQQNDAMASWQLGMRMLVLKDEIAQYPDNNYLQYMQGLMLLNQNMIAESVSLFDNARKNVNIGYFYAPHLFKCLSFAYLCLERHNDALKVLDEGVEHFASYSDLFVLRAEVYQQLGRSGSAMQDLYGCLKIREHSHLVVPPPEIGSAYIYESLGDIFLEAQSHEYALRNYLLAYQSDNSDTDVRDKIYRVIELAGSSAEVKELLDAYRKDESFSALLEKKA